MSIPVSPKSWEAAKNLILDLLAASPDGEIERAGRLNKSFYLAHLWYWKMGDGVLTDYPIVHLPEGPPGPDQYKQLLHELEAEGKLAVSKRPVGPFTADVFTLTMKRSLDGDPIRVESVKKAVHFCNKHTASQLSKMIHEWSQSWQSTPPGYEMDIYGDLLSDLERTDIAQAIAAFETRQEHPH